MVCKYCNTDNSPNATYCVNCGSQLEMPTAEQAPQVEAQKEAINNASYAPQKPMGWFKFLIYFSLFASAIINIINAVQFFTGDVYGNSFVAAAVYLTFPAMQVLDMIYGVILIAISAFLVVTRFQLAGYKKNGPKMVVIAYVLNVVISLAYVIFASAMTGINLFDASMISSLLISIVMAVANNIYFKNRKEMFVK